LFGKTFYTIFSGKFMGEAGDRKGVHAWIVAMVPLSSVF
jgi:hypothetical protein